MKGGSEYELNLNVSLTLIDLVEVIVPSTSDRLCEMPMWLFVAPPEAQGRR